MTIQEGELIECRKCGNDFQWVPRNSTIKPKICPRCQKLKDFEKKREYNKKMLSRSNLMDYKRKSDPNPGKYTPKNKSGLKRTKKRNKSEKAKARDNADLWFSRYIRCKYHYQILVDGTILCKCFITGKLKEAKNIDNGHCFSRVFLLTRYEEDNCRPQGRSSNRFSGEADHYKFRDNLLEEISEERFNRLDELRKKEGEDSVEFYREQADKFRKLTNEILKEYKIKKWW